jgi:sarcosine oxidase subunit gamma
MPELRSQSALDRSQLLALPEFVMRDAGSATRLIFRGHEVARAKLSEALYLKLPKEPCSSSARPGLAGLWLGPDEWLLIAPEPDDEMLLQTINGALVGVPHALVDVSHRDEEFVISGRLRRSVINAGCPLDLHDCAFPIGMCTRTVIAKAQVVLWRPDEDSFRLHVARSFARYLESLLGEVARGWQAANALQ